LLARDGKRYAYRLTGKGTKVSLLFIIIHKRLCGRLQTSSFTIGPLKPHGPTGNSKPPSTRPTTPSKTSSSCAKLPEFVEVFLFTNETIRI